MASICLCTNKSGGKLQKIQTKLSVFSFICLYFRHVWRRSTMRFKFCMSMDRDIALWLFEWGRCSCVRTFSSQTLTKSLKQDLVLSTELLKTTSYSPSYWNVFIKFLKLSKFPFKLHSFFWFLGPSSRTIKNLLSTVPEWFILQCVLRNIMRILMMLLCWSFTAIRH